MFELLLGSRPWLFPPSMMAERTVLLRGYLRSTTLPGGGDFSWRLNG
jgi:hypothetical protein